MHTVAEKRLRTRCVKKVVTEFNEVTNQLTTMSDTPALYEDQMKSMNEKIQKWKFNVGTMQGKQGVLRLRLLELGVDVNKLTKSGPAVEGIHFRTTTTVAPSTTLTPSATVSRNEDLGTPVEMDVPKSTIQADIHLTPTVKLQLTFQHQHLVL